MPTTKRVRVAPGAAAREIGSRRLLPSGSLCAQELQDRQLSLQVQMSAELTHQTSNPYLNGAALEQTATGSAAAPPQGLDFISVLKQNQPATDAAHLTATPEVQAQTPARPDLSLQQEVQLILKMLDRLPSNTTVPVQDVQAALSSAGIQADPRLAAILDGVTSVQKSGSSVIFKRSHASQITYNESMIDGAVQINSMNFGNISFNLAENSSGTSIKNLKGLSLTLTAFGHRETLPIVGASMAQDQNGNSVLTGQIENPLPQKAQYVFDTKPTIPIQVTLTRDGQVITPSIGQSLREAAAASGNTFPGMVLANELNDAAAIADFADKNPVWMEHTVYPILNQFAGSFIKKQMEAAQAGTPQTTASEQTGRQPASATETAGTTLNRASDSTATATPDSTGASPAGTPIPENPLSANQSAAKTSSDATITSTKTGTAPVDQATGAKAGDLPAIPGHITQGGEYSQTITVDGAKRHYLLFVPSSYDPSKPMPVVLALHGLGGNAAQFERDTGLDKVAEQQGFIVAYPDATRWMGANGWTAWDTNNGIIPPGSSASDVKFLRTIIDDTQKQANVDPKHIYMTGLSNGGMMSFDAASALSDKIAAIAIISGGMSGREKSPTEPISILNMHGTADTTIPYNGIQDVPNVLSALGIPTFQPFDYAAKYWTKIDGITGAPTVTRNGNQVIQDYVNPTDGAEVEQVTNIGGEHVPKNPAPVMQMVWQFLDAHPKIQPTKENTPPTIAPILGEPVNPADQFVADLKKRGVTGIESDLDRVVTVLPALQDGSVSPQQVMGKVRSLVDISINNPILNFFNTTQSMAKQGDHYTLTRRSPAVLPINYKIPGTGGLASLKDLSIGSTSFDMNTENQLLHIDNVSGLTADLGLAGFSLKSKIESVTEQKFKDGSRDYKVAVSQPLPHWARVLLMEPSTIPINVKFDSNGNPQVENQTQIEDAMIGENPLVRGTYDEVADVSRLLSHPNWSNGGNLAKDTAITTAVTVGAGVLGSVLGGRVKTGATLGFLLAPMAVDGIDKLLQK